jgi:release factor glutamine methyltransferase
VTLAEAINKAAATLSHRGISNARLDAELLLRHVLGQDRAWILAHIRDILGAEHQKAFDRLISRREKREPLQYITGIQEFWGLDFIVTPDVLIPRPETELIVESSLRTELGAAESPLIVDLCTGSGCIAVSLAKELPASRILATDRSEKALDVARQNARKHEVSARIRFFHGDLFEPLDELDIRGRVDIMVSNPPYVPDGILHILQPEVRDHEPELALVAGPEGTEIHQRIINAAPEYLRHHGSLIMEMGIGQAEKVGQMVRASGAFDTPDILKDLAGIERVIVAKKK